MSKEYRKSFAKLLHIQFRPGKTRTYRAPFSEMTQFFNCSLDNKIYIQFGIRHTVSFNVTCTFQK